MAASRVKLQAAPRQGALDKAVRDACVRHAGRAAAATLAPIVRVVVDDVLGGRAEPPRLREEVEALARFIARARREIRAIGADAIAGACIPAASDELSAIGLHLEEATGAILDSCERIQEHLDGRKAMKPLAFAAAVGSEVTRVFEACNFQDLTGQRITKVIQTLQEIESRTDGLLRILRGGDPARPRAEPKRPKDERSGDAALLNGPAKPGEGVSQSDIDALLGGG